MNQAIKIANKAKMKRNFFSKTKDALTALEREIAVMKKLVSLNFLSNSNNADNIIGSSKYREALGSYRRPEGRKTLSRHGFGQERSCDVKKLLET